MHILSIRRTFPLTSSLPIQVPLSWRDTEYFTFPSLSMHPHLLHAVFTRNGGTSRPPYNSLNTGYLTGDMRDNVDANLERIKQAMGSDKLVFMNQVHGDNIFIIKRDQPPLPEIINDTDGLITDIPKIQLMVKQADCQAVILYDPVKKVIANIHCGWKGNALNILGTAVARMKSSFGCDPSILKAGIGPSLGPCCAEFTTYKNIFPACFKEFKDRKNRFDLWGISRMQLTEAGLKEDNIEIAGICTKCNTDLFFSYRAEKDTGRFASVVMLS